MRVVIVAPPPGSGFDIGRCLERKVTGRLILGTNSNCKIAIADYRSHQAPVLNFLDRVGNETGVNVVHFDKVLCSEGACSTDDQDGTFIYLDDSHFSYEGSIRVAKRMDFGNLLQKMAR